VGGEKKLGGTRICSRGARRQSSGLGGKKSEGGSVNTHVHPANDSDDRKGILRIPKRGDRMCGGGAGLTKLFPERKIKKKSLHPPPKDSSSPKKSKRFRQKSRATPPFSRASPGMIPSKTHS